MRKDSSDICLQFFSYCSKKVSSVDIFHELLLKLFIWHVWLLLGNQRSCNVMYALQHYMPLCNVGHHCANVFMANCESLSRQFQCFNISITYEHSSNNTCVQMLLMI